MRLSIIIVISSIILSLLIGEIGIRMLLSEGAYIDRYLLWSSPLFVQENDGTVRYIPNQDVREVAVYNGAIEYDISFRTNNYGLEDYDDYGSQEEFAPNVKRVAILGDSFTSGAGGEPWVPLIRSDIRQKDPSIYLYNLGQHGASLDHLYKNLVHFDKIFHFTHIVISAITDDFHRLYWYPITDEKEIRMCPDGEQKEVCLKRYPMANVFDSKLNEEEILGMTRTLRKTWNDSHKNEQSFFGTIFRKLRIVDLVFRYLEQEPLFALAEKEQKIGDALKYYLEKKNWEALTNIKIFAGSRPLSFVHLPEKAEVPKQEYALDVSSRLSEIGYQYFPALKSCSWDITDYHKNDTHPNKKGYRVVAQCVKNFLTEWIPIKTLN